MDIKKLIITFLTLILYGHLVYSSPAPLKDTLETKTILYKVIHPNFEQVSYLFGTHHAFDKPFFDSLKFAKEALLSSDILIKENLNIPGHLAEDLINKRSATIRWKKYLNSDNYSYVKKLFASGKLDFDKMTPAELYAFLSRYYKESICIGKDSTANYFSLDDYIGMVAEAHQIMVVGLETTEEQVALINNDVKGMPRKVHKRRLESMIHRIRSGSDDHCAEIEWYRNMNFDFKLNEPCRNTLVLTDRNEQWIIPIQDYFKSKNCFVAVGLSHLMFDCGLINKLKGLGYEIIPVDVR